MYVNVRLLGATCWREWPSPSSHRGPTKPGPLRGTVRPAGLFVCPRAHAARPRGRGFIDRLEASEVTGLRLRGASGSFAFYTQTVGALVRVYREAGRPRWGARSPGAHGEGMNRPARSLWPTGAASPLTVTLRLCRMGRRGCPGPGPWAAFCFLVGTRFVLSCCRRWSLRILTSDGSLFAWSAETDVMSSSCLWGRRPRPS